jgi:hypothetical protein
MVGPNSRWIWVGLLMAILWLAHRKVHSKKKKKKKKKKKREEAKPS